MKYLPYILLSFFLFVSYGVIKRLNDDSYFKADIPLIDSIAPSNVNHSEIPN